MFDAFSSSVHYKDNVYVISKKNNRFHVWGQDFGCFRKPASQLIRYAHIDPVTDLCTLGHPKRSSLAWESADEVVDHQPFLIIIDNIFC